MAMGLGRRGAAAAALTVLAWAAPLGTQAQEYNSAESLCAVYAGRPYVHGLGQVHPMTCDHIRATVRVFEQGILEAPLDGLARVVAKSPDYRWDRTLGRPSQPDYRDCKREQGSGASWTCPVDDEVLRFVLNPGGTLNRIEIVWDWNRPDLAAVMQGEMARKGIDHFTDDGRAMMMHAVAMRFRRIVAEGVRVTPDGRTLNISIHNMRGG